MTDSITPDDADTAAAKPLLRIVGGNPTDEDVAVITALIARAAALGRTRRPAPEDLPIALREGWIHVPDSGLDELPLSSRRLSRPDR